MHACVRNACLPSFISRAKYLERFLLPHRHYSNDLEMVLLSNHTTPEDVVFFGGVEVKTNGYQQFQG
jgi:hypothetical protein